MKKMSVTTTLALLLVLILGSTMAYAGFNWDGDPIFKVEGTTVKVLLRVDGVFDPSEVSVVLRVPEGVEARIASSHGFDCDVVYEGKVSDDGMIPVRVTVDAQDAGSSVWVTVQVPKYGISESGGPGFSIVVDVQIPVKKVK